ncbi:outer membrane beta-barrel protein [Xylanibacter oryzae]|uniref:outer membrane beta-barrel protein n=1 Tax=Xylanibacter oryzae TaxID=185293 RepID=UPI0005680A81|nr:outer membrane beta-barrel protein [Xylanibacter oryzae]
MKKKLLMLVMGLMTVMVSHAQFEEGKIYAGASLSGLDLNYSGKEHTNFGAQAKLGYMCLDNLMVFGQASYQHSGNDDIADYASIGVGGRYYIIQNGLYLGAGVKLIHANHSYNDFMPEIEMGYAFFISHTATIEPSIYYDQSFKNHSDYSKIGFRIGFGLYI